MVNSKKVILITGCSSGFGLHMAARLAAKGHQVIATMRDINKSGALREEAKHRQASLDILPLDVTKPDSIKKAIKEIAGKYGVIDVLINNAGCGIGGFFEDMADKEVRDLFDVNFFGVLNVIREVIPIMRPRRSGKIINVSSIAGIAANPGFSAYSASKWALEGFCESLRTELQFFGIDVLMIEPGVYKTKIFYENAHYAKNFANETSPYYSLSKYLDQRMRERINDCFKDPEEIAHVAEKLIDSPNPSFRNIPDIESKIRSAVRRFFPFQIYSYILRKAMFGKFGNVL